nr:uncharacterized protein LOC117680534 isoform X2 [Crassostrea gigas]
MMEIKEEMKGSSDGLFDRFSFWLLPGYIYNGKKMREAHNSFRTSFLLHSLNPVFLEIYRAHSTASFIVYRFSSEAQDFFNDIEDRQILERMEGQISIQVDISLDTITNNFLIT